MDLQPAEFQFLLTTSEAESVLLEYAPAAWEDGSIQIQRDTANYMGGTIKFSNSFLFNTKARDLLKNEFFKNGIEGVGQLVVRKLKNDWSYSDFFSGFIDFSNVTLEEVYFEGNFMDGSLQAAIKANESTVYDISLNTETDTFKVNLPPAKLLENASHFSLNTSEFSVVNWNAWGFIIAMNLVQSNVRVGSVYFKDQYANKRGSNNTSPNSFYDSGNFFAEAYKAGTSIKITMDGIMDLVQYNLNGVGQAFNLMLYDVYFDPSDQQIKHTSTFLVAGRNFNPQITEWTLEVENRVIYHTVNSDTSRLFIAIYPSGAGTTPEGSEMLMRLRDFTFKFEYVDYTEGGQCIAMSPIGLFKQLIKKASKNKDIDVKSNFLESIQHIQITSGDAIRGIAENQLLIKTSWRDFFKSISAFNDVYFDVINGVPTIELLEERYNNDLLIDDIGEVTDLKVNPMSDLMFSSIKAGIPSQTYETELGREEINNGQEWSTGITRVDKTLDITSAYRNDSYGINEVRIRTLFNPNRNPTDTDGESDNDVFLIYCDPASLFNPTTGRSTYDVLTLVDKMYSGISENEYFFNYLISPKNFILRKSRFIKSTIFSESVELGSLEMSYSDKWKDFNLLSIDSILFSERDPIKISDLGERYFLPFMVSFNAAIPESIIKSVEDRSNGYVTFTYNGKIIKMFIMDIKYDFYTESSEEVKGFLTADTDLNDLY